MILASSVKDKSIALVGNAESLLHLNYSDKIDSHDVVCRFNYSAVCRDVSKLGKRTDIAFLNVSSRFRNLDSQIYKIHVSNKLRHLSKHIDAIPENSNINIARLADVGRPSSGLMVLHYLITYCTPRQIHLYGFDFNKSKTWYNSDKSSPHQFDKEELYIRNLITTLPDLITHHT